METELTSEAINTHTHIVERFQWHLGHLEISLVLINGK